MKCFVDALALARNRTFAMGVCASDLLGAMGEWDPAEWNLRTPRVEAAHGPNGT